MPQQCPPLVPMGQLLPPAGAVARDRDGPILYDGRQEGLFVFSQWSADADDPSTPEMDAITFNAHQWPCPVMWSIDVWAYEIIQKPTAQQPATPITTKLSGADLHCSKLKVEIGFHSASGGTVRRIDIGQGMRTNVHSNYVDVRLLVPKQHLIGPKQLNSIGNQIQFETGIVLSTAVGCYIAPSTSTYAGNVATDTITVRVPANTADVETRVPPGARTVSVYQAAAGVPATLQWRLDAGGPSAGQLAIPADRRILDASRPANACVISSGPADPVARDITYVFGLEI